MTIRMRRIRGRGVALALVGAVTLAGWFCALAHATGSAAQAVAQGQTNPGDPGSRVCLEVLSLLREHYVSDVDLGELVRAYSERQSIADMLAVLDDPYTRYMDRYAYAALIDDLRSTFDGIGVTMGIHEGQLTVIAPLKGTPGERAGLRPLDRVKSIDGKPTKDMALEYAVSLIKGKRGTEVALGIERDENGVTRAFEVRIVRDTIKVPQVSSKLLDDGIGYIEIASFKGDDTADVVADEIARLMGQGMQGLVLDLRFNTGGSFPLAIQLASKFLPAGVPVVHLVGRDGNKLTYYSGPGKKATIPLVLLVNEASASASEIVAGALQDTKAATIVGATTFGKGVVVTIYPLSDGSAVTITTHKYLTSAGNAIDKKGITPDVVVSAEEKAGGEVGETSDVQLDKAVEILKAQIQRREAIGLAR